MLMASVKISIPIMESNIQMPQKIKIDLPFDSAMLFFVIYPKEKKPAYKKLTSTPMFTVHNN